MSTVLFDVPWFVDVGRMLLAAALGALIGWERERSGRGIYHLAAITAVLILGVLELYRLPGWDHLSHRARNGHNDANGNAKLDDPETIISELKAASDDKTGIAITQKSEG